MKKLLIIFMILILALGALIAAVAWLIQTPRGIHTLFAVFSHVTPYEINAQKITGRITEDLRLEGLEVRWPQGSLEAEVFHVRWQTLEPWGRKAILEKLDLKNLKILDHRPPSQAPPEFHFPRAAFWLTRLELGVEHVAVEGLSYVRGDQAPVKIEKISGGILWQKGLLAVHDFRADSVRGHAEGWAKIGLYYPSLHLDLRGTLAKAFGSIDSLTVVANLEAAKGPLVVEGPVELSGSEKSEPRLRVQGIVALAENKIVFREFQIWQAGRGKIVKAGGELQFSQTPPLRVRMTVSDLDLKGETGISTDISGSIEISGSSDRYRGRLKLINRGEAWKSIQISSDFRGNRESADFQSFRIDWLEGFLQGRLKLSWAEGLAIEGNIQGRDLNPGAIDSSWPGRINVDLEGKYLASKNVHRGAVTARFLKSRLREEEFTGALDADLAEDLLHLSRFELRGPGLELQAHGILQERVELFADIRDLSGFVPAVKGQVQGAGWIRYRKNSLRGEVDLKGKDLESGTVRVGSWESRVGLEVPPEKREPTLNLSCHFQRISSGAVFADSAVLSLKGTLSDHRAEVSLHWPKGEISGALSGSYRDRAWNGTLRKLQGKDPTGTWTLVDPAKISVSSDRLKIPSLQIAGRGRERLQVSLDLALDPLRGALQADWRQIDLAHANLWLRKEKLTGRTDGKISAQWQNEGTKISAALKTKGSYSREPFRVAVSSAEVRGDWNERGLKAFLSLQLAGKGKLKAELSSPDPPARKVPQEGDFRIAWSALDLGLLQPVVPSALALKGDLSGSVKGRWSPGPVFDLSGAAEVMEGNLSWERKGAKIRAKAEKAEAEFSWRGKTLAGKVSLVLSEYGELKGDFQVPLEARIQPAIYPAGPLRINLEAQFRDAGLLASVFPARIRESRGEGKMNLDVQGTWERPRLQGSAFLKRLGIQFILPQGGKTGEGKESSARPDSLNLEVSSAQAEGKWAEKGLQAHLSLELNGKGTVQGDFSSPEPARLALPEKGEMKVGCESLDLAILNFFLPPSFDLKGLLSGFIQGQWLPGLKVDLSGEAKVSKGGVAWRQGSGIVEAKLKKAETSFSWREKSLKGSVSLALADYGWLKGDFHLPVEARIPPAFDSGGSLHAVLQGKFEEKGLIPALFPGMVQKTRGRIEVEARAAGTWQNPEFRGSLQLSEAGAVIPSLGIELKDLNARVRLQDEKVVIESLSVQSGPGRIEGKGTVWLEGWRPRRYEGTLKGERFQAVYLSEIRALVSPRLDIEGTLKKLQVRGEINVPQLLVYGKPTADVVRASPDTVIVDKAPRRKFPLELDVQIRIRLGDRVLVNAYGLDARLSGELEVKAGGTETARAQGEIKVEKGHYSVYGVNLEITKGHFLFAGGAITEPTLDILAVRRVKDVEAGVVVTGSAQQPVIQLHSNPAMADTDTLSYIIFGRPFSGSDPKQVNLLLTAAGMLLSRAESVSLQDRVKNLVGLDTLEVQAGSGDLTSSMLTVGKYLTPDLYVSLGYSVFSKTPAVTMRTVIVRKWEIESTWGTEGGIDLFYKIEFY